MVDRTDFPVRMRRDEENKPTGIPCGNTVWARGYTEASMTEESPQEDVRGFQICMSPRTDNTRISGVRTIGKTIGRERGTLNVLLMHGVADRCQIYLRFSKREQAPEFYNESKELIASIIDERRMNNDTNDSTTEIYL